MRIISKFKDFYDRAQGFGVDESIVFVRQPSIYETASVHRTRAERHHEFMFSMLPSARTLYGDGARVYGSSYIYLEPFLIAFCGKLYPGVRAHKPSGGLESPEDMVCAYSVEDVYAFIKKVGIFKKLPKPYTDLDEYLAEVTLGGLRTFLNGGQSDQHSNYFIERREAIVVAENAGFNQGYVLHTNVALEPYQFWRILPAPLAYQELSLYFGGILAPEGRPMVEIEDKYRIAQAGFDKTSFRKSPQKKR